MSDLQIILFLFIGFGGGLVVGAVWGAIYERHYTRRLDGKDPYVITAGDLMRPNGRDRKVH